MREWVLDAAVRCASVDGGPVGGEALLLGLENGVVLQVFVDNAFPVELVKAGAAVVCCTMSVHRRKASAARAVLLLVLLLALLVVLSSSPWSGLWLACGSVTMAVGGGDYEDLYPFSMGIPNFGCTVFDLVFSLFQTVPAAQR